MVQGHVDAWGTVESVTIEGDDYRISVEVPDVLVDLIVPQGSVCLAGISLTIAAVHEGGFTVALIPTTVNKTRLGDVQVGDRLNIEVDMMVRAVAHIVRRMRDQGQDVAK
jgi:riboflavin synthase